MPTKKKTKKKSVRHTRKRHHRRTGTPIEIVENPLHVAPDPAYVDDFADWNCATSTDWVVTFRHSPFSRNVFHSGHHNSGKPKPGSHGAHKYTVQVGNAVIDPQVIIH